MWDIRTTDLWVHQLDAQYGNVIRSWNILSDPAIPEIPAGGYMRIDARLKNFGTTHGVIRLVLQTIGRQTGTQGGVIYSSFSGDLAPGVEYIGYHWVQMWSEPVYQRLWVDDAYSTNGNCPAGAAPPWPDTCRQGELFGAYLDSNGNWQLGSSRHLVAINLPSPPSVNDIQVIVHSATTGGPIQGAVVTLQPSSVQLTADVDGLVDFSPVSAGTYSVLVRAAGFNDGFVANIIVPPNQQVPVDLTGGPSPPPSSRYSCVGGQCVADVNGQYSSLQECQAACTTPTPPPRYNCVSGQCAINANGQYATLGECMSACNAPPPTRYSCVGGQCHPDANGQYANLQECQTACTQQPPRPPQPPWIVPAIIGGGLALFSLAYYVRRRRHK